ncbi:putative transposable element [Trichonephila clavipes]|nr:putative transposable element [Trichonephila clavipes]
MLTNEKLFDVEENFVRQNDSRNAQEAKEKKKMSSRNPLSGFLRGWLSPRFEIRLNSWTQYHCIASLVGGAFNWFPQVKSLILVLPRSSYKPLVSHGPSPPNTSLISCSLTAYGGSLSRLIFDEAHFWLNGYVNKQNCRIWSETNPQVYVETPLHPEKLTVWCALWAGGIIGPYFFKNDEGHNELWFQQDGGTCHTARATIDLLKDTFGDRLISRFGPVNWPPRSCDLTPLDYFLWGYVKSLVYADKPRTLENLEDTIRRVIADIRPQMLEKVIENWTSRLDYIRASRDSHMPEIIFKM